MTRGHLQIKWVPVGARYQHREYDGDEWVEILDLDELHSSIGEEV